MKFLLAVIYTRSVERSTKAAISNKRAQVFGLSRAAKYRAMNVLDENDVVSTLKRGKKCTVVTLPSNLKPRARAKYFEAVRLDWLSDVCQLSGNAIRAALCIHFSKYLEDTDKLIISNERFGDFNVNRQRKVEALRTLQEAGFIEYTPAIGRNPIIHLARSSTPTRILVRTAGD